MSEGRENSTNKPRGRLTHRIQIHNRRRSSLTRNRKRRSFSLNDLYLRKKEEEEFELRYLQMKRYEGNLKLKKLCRRLRKNLRNISQVKFSAAFHNDLFSKKIQQAEAEMREVESEDNINKNLLEQKTSSRKTSFNTFGHLKENFNLKNLIQYLKKNFDEARRSVSDQWEALEDKNEQLIEKISVFKHDRDSHLTQFWFFLIFMIIIYQFCITLYFSFFECITHLWILKGYSNWIDLSFSGLGFLYVIDITMDILLFLDFFLANFQPFHEVFAIIPLDYVVLFLMLFLKNHRVVLGSIVRIFRINRAILFKRIPKYFQFFERVTGSIWFRIMKFFLILCAIVHIVCCFWYLTIVVEGSPQKMILFSENDDLPNRSKFEIFLFAYYWSFVTMTGYGGTMPASLVQIIYSLFVCVVGCVLYISIIGTTTSLIEEIDIKQTKKKIKIDNVKNYINFLNLDNNIRKRIIDYYHFLAKNREWDEKVILEELPSYLRIEVALDIKKDIVKAVPLFREANENFIASVVLKLKPRVALTGAEIIRKGDTGREMYFLAKGVVKVTSEDKKIIYAVLRQGAFFGEIALTHKTKRNATIMADTYCELYILTKDDFEKLELDYPVEFASIREAAEKRRLQTAQK